jgi:hypothetical protein
MQEKIGTFIATFWLGSPIVMGLFKLLDWEPFGNLPWWVVFFTWIYTLLVLITRALWSLPEAGKEKPPINRDLH